MVYAVASEKGGVGKTTIAFQLSVLLAQKNRDVLLIDADPQGSALEVASVRDEEGHKPSITCVSITGKGLAGEVRKLLEKYQDIVIDCGGRDTAALRSSLLVAQKVVVPVLPGQLDAWTLDTMDEIVEQAQGFNPDLKGFVFLNKVDTNPKIQIAESVATFAKDLKTLKLMNSRMGYRVAYRRAIAEGMAVTEMSKSDKTAISEVENFYNEVSNHA